MLSRRNLLEVAAIAVPLALAGCGRVDSRMTTNIPGERLKVDFLSNYDEARRKARQTDKPLLIVVKPRWCRFSRELLRESFTSRQAVDTSRKFVCLLVDADRQTALCKRLQTNDVYPTVLLMSPTGVLINRVEGSRTSRELVADMDAALTAYARGRLSQGKP